MTKTLAGMFVMIAIIKYSEAQESSFDNMTCGNCTGVNEECNVTTTGWSCDFDLLIDNSNSSQIPESISECMLPGMEFKENQVLHGYCCIWSPEIGCQKLKLSSDDNEDFCYGCTRATWSKVMDGTVCPCGDWFMDRVSSEMMHKPWTILLITKGMLLIILNL